MSDKCEHQWDTDFTNYCLNGCGKTVKDSAIETLQSKLDCAVRALEDIENFIEYIKKCDHSTTESERARLALEEIRK